MWRPVAVVSRARSKARRRSPPCARARQKTAPSCVAETGRPRGRRSAAPLASSMAITPNNPSRRRARRTTRSIALRADAGRRLRLERGDGAAAAAGQQLGHGRRVGPPHRVDDQQVWPELRGRRQQRRKGCIGRARPIRPSRPAASETRDAAPGSRPGRPKRRAPGRPAARSCPDLSGPTTSMFSRQRAAMRSRSAIDAIERARGDQTLEGRIARLAAAQDQHRPRRGGRRKDHHALPAVTQAEQDGIRTTAAAPGDQRVPPDAPGREISPARLRARHCARHGWRQVHSRTPRG